MPQSEVTRHIDILLDLRHRLQQLRVDIENAGYALRCEWRDEYGGTQGVLLGRGDKLIVEKE